MKTSIVAMKFSIYWTKLRNKYSDTYYVCFSFYYFFLITLAISLSVSINQLFGSFFGKDGQYHSVWLEHCSLPCMIKLLHYQFSHDLRPANKKAIKRNSSCWLRELKAKTLGRPGYFQTNLKMKKWYQDEMKHLNDPDTMVLEHQKLGASDSWSSIIR